MDSARSQRLASLQRERLLFGSSVHGSNSTTSPASAYFESRGFDGGGGSEGTVAHQTNNNNNSNNRSSHADETFTGRLLVGRDGRHVFVEDHSLSPAPVPAPQPPTHQQQLSPNYANSYPHQTSHVNAKLYPEYHHARPASRLPQSPVSTPTTLVNNAVPLLSPTFTQQIASASDSTFDETMASLAALVASGTASAAAGHSASHHSCPTCTAKKQLALMDAWKPAGSATHSGTSKKSHHKYSSSSSVSTDKTLLSLIEQERSKYLLLESTHTALLSQLSHLHQAHRADMARLSAQHVHTLNNTRLDMRDQNDRVGRAARVLVSLLNRHAAVQPGSDPGVLLDAHSLLLDSTAGGGTGLRDPAAVVEALVGRVDATLRAYADRVDAGEARERDVEARRGVVADKLETREAELRRMAVYAQGKEAELAGERESRVKLEVKAMYLEEIEVLATRERKLAGELEATSKAYSAKCKEVETLTVSHGKESQSFKDLEARLRKDLNESYRIGMQHAEELTVMEKNLRATQQEAGTMKDRLHEQSAQLQELRQHLQQRESELSIQRQLELDLRLELQSLRNAADSSAAELATLDRQLADTRQRLDAESVSKTTLQQQNTSRLGMVAEKIGHLQQSLNETQHQLAEFRETEATLRATLRQREDLLAQQAKKIAELEMEISELQGSLNSESAALENVKSKKKEELMAVQEKFALAKEAMEKEVMSLRNQLSSKSATVSSQGEELSKIKIELSELTADRFRLEARCAELLAHESTNSRQNSNIAQLLKQKEQDLAIMGIKHEALVEQVRLLEEELRMYRESTSYASRAAQQDAASAVSAAASSSAAEFKRSALQNSVEIRRLQNEATERKESSLYGLGSNVNSSLAGVSAGPSANIPSAYSLLRQSSNLSQTGSKLSGDRSRSNSNLITLSPVVPRSSNFDQSKQYVNIGGLDDYSLSFAGELLGRK
ncbi:hypothetical protein BC830DRAFT_847134 [Chytriomyces sp. MP71]|nr:hypothetical protein BC830DRAFT_847134 [Chytriomyces sp. MP71]